MSTLVDLIAALGLSADGKAGFDYVNGRFTADDDKVCVNLSGGLKAKGHPVGATTNCLITTALTSRCPSLAPTPARSFRAASAALTICSLMLSE